MFTVGLTGGIGSGKTTVANKFNELGIELVDADVLARVAVETGSEALSAIEKHFGSSVINADGSLDRSALREIVFHAPDERRWLEQLTHPIIGNLIKQGIQNCSSPYCLLVSPLLLETEQHKLTQRILVVDVSEETQLQRASSRDGSDPATIKAIIEAQMRRESRLEAADDVIENELPKESLERRVMELHQHYLELAKQQ